MAGIVLSAALAACSATRLKTAWRDPGITQIRFRKVAAFVVTKDEALRRSGEQELCAQIKGAPCVPAYSVVPGTEVADPAKVKARLEAAGVDGAVVIRLVGRRVKETYVPPTPMPMWGFYGGAWPMAYDPGYVRQDDLVDVQTSIYSVPDGRLLWTGKSETTNPRDVRRTVAEIADAVAFQLRYEGLVPAQ
jgi:hypothetical protein